MLKSKTQQIIFSTLVSWQKPFREIDKSMLFLKSPWEGKSTLKDLAFYTWSDAGVTPVMQKRRQQVEIY